MKTSSETVEKVVETGFQDDGPLRSNYRLHLVRSGIRRERELNMRRTRRTFIKQVGAYLINTQPKSNAVIRFSPPKANRRPAAGLTACRRGRGLKGGFQDLFHSLSVIVSVWGLFLAALGAQTTAPSPTTNTPAAQGEVRSAYVLSLKDFGSEDIAYLSLPQTAPEIAVVVLPGLDGLNKETKNKCDFLASQGFIVLALDLFNGQVPRDQADAVRLQNEVRIDSASKTIESGRRFFAESPRFKTDRAVLMAWSTNAPLALHAANKIKDLSGLILAEPWLKKGEKIEHPKVPTLIACAQNDPSGLWLIGELSAEDNKLISPLTVAGNPGFLLAQSSEKHRSDVWGGIVSFIRQCAQNTPAEKSFIDKIF